MAYLNPRVDGDLRLSPHARLFHSYGELDLPAVSRDNPAPADSRDPYFMLPRSVPVNRWFPVPALRLGNGL